MEFIKKKKKDCLLDDVVNLSFELYHMYELFAEKVTKECMKGKVLCDLLIFRKHSKLYFIPYMCGFGGLCFGLVLVVK